jgi:hypothetical protein
MGEQHDPPRLCRQTEQALDRVLSDLKRRGVVDVSSHSITLLDRFALEAVGED